MNVLIDNLDLILSGFRQTLSLLIVSAFCSLVLGTLLAAMRVSPIPTLRWAGAGYVNITRNIPLVLHFLIIVFGLPELGFNFSFYIRAIIALSIYTAAFVCEALRSGINTVQPGQAEAARAIGMTFRQTLSIVVLPQAFRSVVPPLASVFIALTKNTAVASGFGITEATFRMSGLVRDNASALWWVFLGVAAGYILIVLVISGVARLLELRLAVAR